MIEGYPTEPQGRSADTSVYTDLVSVFRKAGFGETVRRSEKRPIMKYALTREEGK